MGWKWEKAAQGDGVVWGDKVEHAHGHGKLAVLLTFDSEAEAEAAAEALAEALGEPEGE